MDKIHDSLTEIKVHLATISSSVDENTRDLKYHIKRTDLLETQVRRVTYLLVAGAAASMPQFLPAIMKVIGL